MDLLDGKTDLDLEDENWAILTLSAQRVPAFISTDADVRNSLISNGCKIYGRVSHSILAPGVTVEKGAEISDSIVLPNAVIKSGARVRAAIVDNKAVINEKADVGLKAKKRITSETNLEDAEITIIGSNAEIESGQIVKAGERVSKGNG
jgi:glucose-1-phosphate adenylyltransferase